MLRLRRVCLKNTAALFNSHPSFSILHICQARIKDKHFKCCLEGITSNGNAPSKQILRKLHFQNTLAVQTKQLLLNNRWYFTSSKQNEPGNDESSANKNGYQKVTKSISEWLIKMFKKMYEELVNWLKKLGNSLFDSVMEYKKRILQSILGYLAIHGESETAFLTSIVDSLNGSLNEQREVEKGKAIQHILNKRLKQQFYQTEWSQALFQCSQYSYKQRIIDLLDLDDNKLMVFIQTFNGSGVAHNLKKQVLNIIYPQPQVAIRQQFDHGKAIPGKKSQKKEGKKSQKKKFDYLFYINLSHPEIYSVEKKDKPVLTEIKDLSNLLNSIIGKSESENLLLKLLSTIHKPFYNKNQKSVLIIDEIQILEQYLLSDDQQKKKEVEQMYKKLKFVQTYRNVRVFVVCNSHTFLQHLRRLKSPFLEDFKYELIEQMNETDVKQIIKSRMAMNTYYMNHQEIADNCSPYFSKLLDYMAGFSNNIRQIMRVLKMAKIDIKCEFKNEFQKKEKQRSEKYFVDHLKLKDMPESAEQFIKQKCSIYKENLGEHFQFLLNLKHNINQIYSKIIQQKRTSILSQIDLINQQKQLSQQAKNEIIKSKVKLLLLIFAGKFKYNTQDSSIPPQKNPLEESFLLKMNRNDMIAYTQLNEAEIIHNLSFSSKGYERAFYRLLSVHNTHFRELMDANEDKELVDSYVIYKEKLHKIQRDLDLQQEKIKAKLKCRQSSFKI